VTFIQKIDGDFDFSKVTLTDDFMFSKVMRDKEFCKPFLETILEMKIKEINYPESQKTIDIGLDAKAVRLDIYADDGEGTVYNIEMQQSRFRDVPKRSRYYQGIIDINILEKGETYHKLPNSLIIFVCTEDFFGLDLPIYRFKYMCTKAPELFLNDGTEKIFVNINTSKINQLTPRQRSVYNYLKDEVTSDEYTQRLHQKVQDVRQNKEWRREYMTLEMMLDEKREEGLEQGLEQGTIITNLKYYYKGKISKEEIMEELSIDEEKFEEYLKEYPKEELLK